MKALFLITAMLLLAGCGAGCHTEVSINGNEFYINGEPTFKGKTWRGMKIQGLLPNARLVNGIFDDKTDSTRYMWAYPDTRVWDAERNTREFVEHMPLGDSLISERMVNLLKRDSSAFRRIGA